MHQVKYQLEESFYEVLLLLLSEIYRPLAEIDTASFIFKMKVLRASMTLH